MSNVAVRSADGSRVVSVADWAAGPNPFLEVSLLPAVASEEVSEEVIGEATAVASVEGAAAGSEVEVAAAAAALVEAASGVVGTILVVDEVVDSAVVEDSGMLERLKRDVPHLIPITEAAAAASATKVEALAAPTVLTAMAVPQVVRAALVVLEVPVVGTAGLRAAEAGMVLQAEVTAVISSAMGLLVGMMTETRSVLGIRCSCCGIGFGQYASWERGGRWVEGIYCALSEGV
ncbi:hypothetical protein OBBRIDRAFT_52936 [Obba rivulosa]|uniref:Uncharacterized protein n=1 Tax=Obba rivulosa TaxID=1052685 RepID=A0A8E2J5C5_9APHY|nr:hypothetical protein OBBRIDRAFT_52936 [Obba rivulosa]